MRGLGLVTHVIVTLLKNSTAFIVFIYLSRSEKNIFDVSVFRFDQFGNDREGAICTLCIWATLTAE